MNEKEKLALYNIKYSTRTIELMTVHIWLALQKFYGRPKALQLIHAFCEIFGTNFTSIGKIIDGSYIIEGMRAYDRIKYQQQIIAMGLSRGYNKQDIARLFFGGRIGTVYTNYLDRLEFLGTDEFVKEYNDSVQVLKYPEDVNNCANFLENFESFLRTFK